MSKRRRKGAKPPSPPPDDGLTAAERMNKAFWGDPHPIARARRQRAEERLGS